MDLILVIIIIHNSNDASFNINFNSQLPTSQNYNSDNLIKLDTSGAIIGTLLPQAYRIEPGLEYFNINNLSYHKENLIQLDTSGVILGKLSFND